MGVLFALIVLACCYRFVSALWLKSHDDDDDGDVFYRVTASYNFLGRDEEASLNMYTTVSCGNDTLSVKWTSGNDTLSVRWTATKLKNAISLKLSPLCKLVQTWLCYSATDIWNTLLFNICLSLFLTIDVVLHWTLYCLSKSVFILDKVYKKKKGKKGGGVTWNWFCLLFIILHIFFHNALIYIQIYYCDTNVVIIYSEWLFM